MEMEMFEFKFGIRRDSLQYTIEQHVAHQHRHGCKIARIRSSVIVLYARHGSTEFERAPNYTRSLSGGHRGP